MPALVKFAWCSCLSFFVATWFTSAVELNGKEGAFIKYSPIKLCQNGSITFEFRTQQRHGLLLYIDGGNKKDFIQVKVTQKSIDLNMELGHGTLKLSVEGRFNDDGWHKVVLIRNYSFTTLKVDELLQKLISKGPDHEFGDGGKKFVYLGGLPISANGYMADMSFQPVLFEPTLDGSIRNVLYKPCGGRLTRAVLQDVDGTRSSPSDQCSTENPCQNDGICLSKDNGIECDCSPTDYTGNRCQSKKIPTDATFFGEEYLMYNLASRGGDAYITHSDSLKIQFKTRHPDGLIFYTGDQVDHLAVYIENRQLYISVNLGSGPFVQSYRRPLDDNRWHDVEVTRIVSEMTVKIDGSQWFQKTTTGDFTLLSSTVIYVGGYPKNQELLKNNAIGNFKGCLRKMLYKADNLNLNMIDKAMKKSDVIRTSGNIMFNFCKDIIESLPVTFTTPESYVTLRGWKPKPNATISLSFKTNEKTGLLMYNGGNNRKSDFFALEVIDNHLYFIINMGSGRIRKRISRGPISDSKYHELKLSHTNSQGSIRLDSYLTHYKSREANDLFTLGSMMYIGGMTNTQMSELPEQIWSASLGSGFIGCIKGLEVNRQIVDISLLAKNQGADGIRHKCKKQEDHCLSQPCLHGGRCIAGWNRYICDCSRTSYTGKFCEKFVKTMNFDGRQYIQISTKTATAADDISIRFKTQKKDGTLFVTVSDQSADSIKLLLIDGILELALTLGGAKQILRTGTDLHDDKWHTLYVRRRGNKIHLKVDAADSVKEVLETKSKTLKYITISIGVPISAIPANIESDTNVMEHAAVDLGGMMADTNEVYYDSSFNGSMQQFIFNKKPYFELIASKKLNNVQYTASISSGTFKVRNPVTLKSKSAYGVLPSRLLPRSQTSKLIFMFRTTEQDGLILYTGRKDIFIAVELTNGYLYFIYDIKSRANRVRIKTRGTLNNNKWHEVTILRPQKSTFILYVDDEEPTVEKLIDPTTPQFLFIYPFYIGGIKKSLYRGFSDSVLSNVGFQGCLASLDFNSRYINVLHDSKTIYGSIIDGCSGPVVECKSDSCQNKGECVQHWTSYRCDCDKTSYTGARCSEESVSYKFGDDLGVITYHYPPGKQPTTLNDHFTLGFVTFSSDVILVRIDSDGTDDFIQMSMVDGNILVTYNLGTSDYVIGEMYSKVNDGRYHVVRFERNGPNSTIQLDELTPQTRQPEGKHYLDDFNKQSTIQIGGRTNGATQIDEAFTGIISGLVFNGKRVLDLASDDDPQVTKQGDVSVQTDDNSIIKVEKEIPEENMQSTQGVATSTLAGITDDIIFAAAGSGCQGDDEEDCLDMTLSGNEDDIITPVITPMMPTSKPRSDKPVAEVDRKNSRCKNGKCKNGRGKKKPPKDKNKNKFKANRKKGHKKYWHGNKNNKGKTHKPNVHENHGNVTADPTVDETTSSDQLDLGLVIGVVVGVIVALIILIILLFKIRRREEGAYKVEETQTFAFVAEGNKSPQINGNSKPVNSYSATSTTSTTKSKKRDVKEWYV